MNQKGNWYIKLRTTKRCDMIKKKARRSPPPSNCNKDRFGTPIKFVNISIRYKYYYKLCWKFYKSWKNPVHHDVNEFRRTSRPWTVENHYKIEIRGEGGGGLEIQKMMNREYNRHEIKGLKFKEISKNWTICSYMYFGIFRYSRTKCQSSCYLQEM